MKLQDLFENDVMKTDGKNLLHLNLPEVMHDSLDCSNSGLTSLEGSPKIVHGEFACDDNQLTSLKGGPEEVYGNVYVSDNKLESLDGAPKIIHGDFYGSNNKLTSLKDIHKHIHELNGIFYISGNRTYSHILGLLLIKNLKSVRIHPTLNWILDKYLPNTRGMEAVFECQEDLISEGFEDYAQL